MTTPTYLFLGSTARIGRVLCERLAKRGASLVLGGRDPAELSELPARTGGEVSQVIGVDDGLATLRAKARA